MTHRPGIASFPSMGIRSFFRGSTLARMSDGSYCLVRDLGLVKGGKGLRHFECLFRFGIFSTLVRLLWD
ncbi:MAG TPA: hypothetical protein VFO36_01730, partial [Nitrospiraceae bacterium]|nr:hypothetical protein [Nitrospiraceae bacterium]